MHTMTVVHNVKDLVNTILNGEIEIEIKGPIKNVVIKIKATGVVAWVLSAIPSSKMDMCIYYRKLGGVNRRLPIIQFSYRITHHHFLSP